MKLSIAFGALESAKLLLQSGASHTRVDKNGETIFHWVATYPNVPIIKYLGTLDLKGLDMNVKNSAGLTAREVLQRQHCSLDTIAAFQESVSEY